MTELIREWRRETENKPFDAAAWNRLASVNNGHVAAFTTWIDGAGLPLVESDPTGGISKVTLAGLATFGATTGVDITANTAIVGPFAVTGASTLTGTLSVSGLVAAAAAVTVGTTLNVAGLLTGAAANFSGLVAMAAAATVGTTLAVVGRASAGTLVAGAAAMAGSEKLRAVGTSSLEGTVTITTGGLVVSANGITVTGTSSFANLLTTTGGIAVPAVGITMANAIALRGTDNVGAVRNLVVTDASNNQIFGTGGGGMAILRGGGVKLQFGTTTMLEVDNSGVGFNGNAPIAPPALGSAATDPATTMALANLIRTVLRDYKLAT